MMDSILVGITLLTRITLLICAVATAAVLLLALLEWKKRYDKRQQQIEEVYAKCMEYRERAREREREMDRRIREREEKKDAGEEGGSGSC